MAASGAVRRFRRSIRAVGLRVVGSLVLSTSALGASAPSPAASVAAAPEPAGAFSVVGTVASQDVDGGRTQTLLPDGRVLIIDGEAAQLWDPTSGSLSPAGELRSSCEWSWTSTLLADGRVLVVGGMHRRSRGETGPRIRYVKAVEVWGPATASFTDAGSLQQGRLGHATV